MAEFNFAEEYIKTPEGLTLKIERCDAINVDC